MKMKQWFKEKSDVEHFKKQVAFLSVWGGVLLVFVLVCEIVGRF